MLLSKRFFKVGILATAIALTGLSATAQRYGDRYGTGYNDVIREIMERLGRMESKLNELDRRVDRLERNDNNYPPYPPAPRPAGFSCLIVDSGYSKVFLGKGQSRLQAETLAKEACGRSVNSVYCNSASVRCSDGTYDPRIKGYFCQVVDSGYNRIFSSEGADIIEAEAKAKQACQSAVNPIYCGNVTARCEAIRQ